MEEKHVRAPGKVGSRRPTRFERARMTARDPEGRGLTPASPPLRRRD